jgi:hypothetical protein
MASEVLEPRQGMSVESESTTGDEIESVTHGHGKVIDRLEWGIVGKPLTDTLVPWLGHTECGWKVTGEINETHVGVYRPM